MKATLLAAAGLAPLAVIACGAPPPAGTPSPTVTVASVAPLPSAVPSASAVPDAAGTGPLKLYPVVRIFSLIEAVKTDGGIELRVGNDPGGGASGFFRYVPLVNGAPDLLQETTEINHIDSTGGFIELAGKRPDLVYHDVSGFRSAPSDWYKKLNASIEWKPFSGGEDGTLGIGISSWTGGSLLEWRAPRIEEAGDTRIPSLRVLFGPAKEAPSIPKSVEKKLVKDGFSMYTFIAFPSGEAIAAGQQSKAKGFGTLLWTDNLRDPKYFATEQGFTAQSDLRFLGGSSLVDVRLKLDSQVMKLDGATWTVVETVPEGSLPDVWFGAPLVQETKSGAFARLAAGAPWRPIVGVAKPGEAVESYAVDSAGAIWKTEDDLLLSSKKPEKELLEITQEVLAASRKARGN